MKAPPFEQAKELHKKGNLAKAESLYLEAFKKNPTNPALWGAWGLLLFDKECFFEAEAAYRVALQLQPHFPAVWINLGKSLLKLDRVPEAIAYYLNILENEKLNPSQHRTLVQNLAAALSVQGTKLLSKGKVKEAEENFQKACFFDPEQTRHHINLSVCRLLQRKFLEAWEDYLYTWKEVEKNYGKLRGFFWDRSPLKGKRLLLVSDQGYGDLIHRLRYCQDLHKQGAQLSLICHERLFPLLKSSRPLLPIQNLISHQHPPPKTDFFLPISQLPACMETTPETIPQGIPYLAADPTLIEQWKKKLSAYSGLRIGIAWQGNPAFKQDAKRSIPLSEWARIAKIPGITLIGLHKEEQEKEEGVEVVQLGSEIDGEDVGAFMDTAALMHSLDLVITSDTVIVHLAGALGIPTWLALPYVGHWMWQLERSDSPWYPTLRIFRQKEPGDWASVFEQIEKALYETFSDRISSPSSKNSLSQRELDAFKREIQELKQAASHYALEKSPTQSLEKILQKTYLIKKNLYKIP